VCAVEVILRAKTATLGYKLIVADWKTSLLPLIRRVEHAIMANRALDGAQVNGGLRVWTRKSP